MLPSVKGSVTHPVPPVSERIDRNGPLNLNGVGPDTSDKTLANYRVYVLRGPQYRDLSQVRVALLPRFVARPLVTDLCVRGN